MQDQGLAGPKLYYIKPSFLALTIGVDEHVHRRCFQGVFATTSVVTIGVVAQGNNIPIYVKGGNSPDPRATR
jgi:hypothetical protein